MAIQLSSRTAPLLSIALIALIALAAGLAAACSGGASDDDLGSLRREIADEREQNRRSQLIAALEPLDPLRYHSYDGMIRNEGRIPSGALVWAARARETLDWVAWPSELADHVEQYAEWLDSLIDPLRDNDPEAAAEPSRITHALAHNFEFVIEAWLNGDPVPAPPPLAGLEPPPHGGHSDQSDQSHMQSDQHQSDQHQSDQDQHDQAEGHDSDDD